MNREITDFLIRKLGFSEVRKTRSQEKELDFNLYSAVKRIHEAHYLFWSETHKAFSIAYKFSSPKGLAGGGSQMFNTVMLPKPIYTIKQAELLIKSITQ